MIQIKIIWSFRPKRAKIDDNVQHHCASIGPLTRSYLQQILLRPKD